MDREEYKKCCESPAYFFRADCRSRKKARREEWKRRDTMRTNMAKTIMKMFPDAFKGKVVLTAKVREDLLKTPIKED